MKFFKLAVPLLLLFSVILFGCEPEGAAGGSATGSAAGGGASGGAAAAPPPDPAIVAATTQSAYAKEEDGAPSRPTLRDTVRHYPEGQFFKNSRYILVWVKEPGTPGPNGDYNPATSYEVQQIFFKDPSAVNDPAKFGAAIDPNDVDRIEVIASGSFGITPGSLTDTKGAQTGSFTNKSGSVQTVSLPTDLLPAVTYPNFPESADASDDANNINKPLNVILDNNAQAAYVAIDNINKLARELVVAYKIRIFRDIRTLDDKGNLVTKSVYNDSQVLFVNARELKAQQSVSAASGGANNNPGGGSKDHVPDVLISKADVNNELGFSANQTFTTFWENKKVTGQAPIEKLITEADYNNLFPYSFQKQNIPGLHDQDQTYYTWANLVEASRYFPNFLNEGTLEDKYRELAAFFGNKSHETGDGYPSLKERRWEMGLVWIVELAALSAAGVTVKTKDDIYKAYDTSSYIKANDPDWPAVKGKSYHGRGPVQLSWNYNYGQMSETLFGDKNILLNNPDLIAREGVYGWASAIWFWMQPQSQKPSAHDVMIGKVDLTEPYKVPTVSPVNNNDPWTREYETTSKGTNADGSVADYGAKQLDVPKGMEVGFGMTINIINGGLESGTLDNRQARRIAFFARYLDYFGKTKMGRTEPLSPKVSSVGLVGGDPVPQATIDAFKDWRKWWAVDRNDPSNPNSMPYDKISNVVSSRYTGPLY